jgi:hypothetical protein
MSNDDPYDNPRSLRFKMRRRRFRKIARLIDEILARQQRCRIIDLGGSEQYWRIAESFLREREGRIEISLVNLLPVQISNTNVFRGVIGNACDMSGVTDNAFDLVHSNSVIEHVGHWEDMKRMAREVRRLAPRYYVQTPYFWFPLEPHYNSIGFHWLPQNVQARRLQRRGFGFMARKSSIDVAMNEVEHVRLLDKCQFAFLFPDARMDHEKIARLTKSLIAVR